MTTAFTRARHARQVGAPIARLLSVALLISAGCSDAASGPETRVVSSLKVVSGDRQVAAAGTSLVNPIVLNAVDASDRPVAGVIVAFTIADGQGLLRAERDTSDATGKIAVEWTVGTVAGQPQRVTASVVPAPGTTTTVSPVQITASVVAGPAAALSVTLATIVGRIGEPLASFAVLLRDRYGNVNATTGVRITARLENTPNATLTGTAEARTDANGISLNALIVTGRAGSGTLLLESDGLAPARINLSLGGGRAARVQATTTTSIDAEAGVSGPSIGARVFDAWDNPVAGVDVTFAFDGSGSLGHATSAADGIATLAGWIAPPLGTYRITAMAAGASGTAVYTLSTHPAGPAFITPAASNPTSGFAGYGVTLTVQVTDAAGNAVPRAPLTVSVAGGGDQPLVTNGAGFVTFVAQLPTKAGAISIVVRASATVSATMTVQGMPGAVAAITAAKETIEAPAGSSMILEYVARDAFGNPIPDVLLYGYSAPGSATSTISPSSVKTDATGVARFTALLDPYPWMHRFYAAISPYGGFEALTTVYGTGPRGVLRLIERPACVYTAAYFYSTGVTGWVFGPDGRAASGVPVTWSVEAGNGFVYSNTQGQLRSVTTQSASNGFVSVGWDLPATPGTFTLTATPAPGYDALSPVTTSCRGT